MPMLLRCAGHDALDARAAVWIAERIAAVTRDRPAVLAVCGGRSVAGIFRRLAQRDDIAWARVHVFLVDERQVPLEHQDSNWRLVQAGLLEALIADARLPATNVHPFLFEVLEGGGQGQTPQSVDGDAGVAQALEKCTQALAALGGRFDVVLLSAGEDAHVAGLFPEHPSIRDPAPYFVAFGDAPKPPPRRVSASRALLLRSGAAILLFIGAGKRNALARFLDDRLDIESCPALLVRSLPESLVLTDLPEPA